MERGVFRTTEGTAVTAVTADEMRAVDDVATDELGLSLLQMMENAGRALAEHVLETTDGPVVVATGNGGDGGGDSSARDTSGITTEASVSCSTAPPPRSRGQQPTSSARSIQSTSPPQSEQTENLPPDTQVVVDALIGYGLSNPARGTAKDLIGEINHHDAALVSLDVPSGLDATSGRADGPVVDPDQVLTLALPKTGLTGLGCPLSLADISIPRWVYEQLDIPYETPFDTRYSIPLESTAP